MQLTEGRLRVLRAFAEPHARVTYNYRIGYVHGLHGADLPRNRQQCVQWLWDNDYVEDTHVRVPGKGSDSYVLALTDKGREALA